MGRSRWFEQQQFESMSPEPFVHESAYVDGPCEIGAGTRIMHFSHIMANSMIGQNCEIGHNVTVASGVLIGNNVKIHNNASLTSGVIVENDVYLGPSTVFAPLKDIRPYAENISMLQPTLVKQGAKVGANATIAAGFTIGRYTFIESGTVVDQNIPDYAMIGGNPIRILGWRCTCGHELKFIFDNTTCVGCGKRYQQVSANKILLRQAG